MGPKRAHRRAKRTFAMELSGYTTRWLRVNFKSREWNAIFGVPYREACLIYNKVEKDLSPERYLWVLHFLKAYPTKDGGFLGRDKSKNMG